MDDAFYNRVGSERLSSRQIDEAIGLARGLLADGKLTQDEVEFLQKWLAANLAISDQPVMRILYDRVNAALADGILDAEETTDLFSTLEQFARRDFELGEALKSTTLPLDAPPPELVFPGHRYCFTGTFTYGPRVMCEEAVQDRGGMVGSLTKKVDYLVIGAYATDSWKHSTFGNKIIKACEWRDGGAPIKIVSEEWWTIHL